MDVSIVAPTGGIVVNGTGSVSLSANTKGTVETLLSATGFGSTGINFTASVSQTLFSTLNASGASFGVVQTIDPFQVYYQWITSGVTHDKTASVSSPIGGPQTEPRPVVDDAAAPATFVGTFYGNQFGEADSSGTTPLNLSDTPDLSVPIADSYMYYNATFKDTLMLLVDGGMWVPLGYSTWTVLMSAGSNLATPPVWSLLSGGVASGVSYTATTQFPAWAESNYYLWSNYGQFVQTS